MRRRPTWHRSSKKQFPTYVPRSFLPHPCASRPRSRACFPFLKRPRSISTPLAALNDTPMPLCNCEIRKVKSGNIADNIHPAGTDTNLDYYVYRPAKHNQARKACISRPDIKGTIRTDARNENRKAYAYEATIWSHDLMRPTMDVRTKHAYRSRTE